MLQHYRKDIFVLFGGNFGANLLYLTSFLIIGAMMNAVEFGTFRVAQAYLSVASSLTMLGMNTAITHKFPIFSTDDRAVSLKFIFLLMVITGAIGGGIAYFLMPHAQAFENSMVNFLYALSFPVALIGANICNMALAVKQSNGNLRGYARLQFQWKGILFLAALLGSLIFHAKGALVAMALSYIFLYFFSKDKKNPKIGYTFFPNTFFLNPKKMWGNFSSHLLPSLFKKSIWPFLSLCVSAIYSNIEFLSIKEAEIQTGIAGAYSLASLIFIGGAAFFIPFQTYAGSLVVNDKISMKGLFKLQGMCLLSVMFLSGLSLGISYILGHLFPIKFNPIFFDFSVLVCLKLMVWGSYAVIGSVLNYIDKGFESFLLSVFCLVLLLGIYILPGHLENIREIVILQIATNFLILFGSILLVFNAYRKKYGSNSFKNSDGPTH